MPEDNVYQELVSFLSSTRPDLQKAAVEAALSVTDQSGMSSLIKANAIRPLCRLASQPSTVGLHALSALANLSSNGTSADQCVEDLIDGGATNRMAEIALTSPPSPSDAAEADEWRRRINCALIVLANITRTERGAVEFCGYSMPDEAVVRGGEGEEEGKGGEDVLLQPARPTLTLLLSRFLLPTLIKSTTGDDGANGNNFGSSKTRHSPETNDDVDDNDNAATAMAATADDPYQHFAAVLMNATQIEQGRRFVMKLQHKKKTKRDDDDCKDARTTSVLQSILPQLRSKNLLRRRGIAGSIKNCCFERDSSYWLLHEVNVVKALLYPLAGPEELDPDDKVGLDPDLWLEGPDKVREPDEFTRLCLVDAILLLLASGRRSREYVRAQKTYVILKVADMSEESEDISASINECVQYLRRDEEGCEEGSSDRRLEDVVRGRRELLALPAPLPSAGMAMPKDDFDAVD